MSNEINFTASLSVFKSGYMAQAISRSIVGFMANMTGTKYSEGSMLVGGSAAAVPLGAITQPHWAFFYSPPGNTANAELAGTITGAANNGSGLVRITQVGHTYQTSDLITVAGVGGTVEANGTWAITVITSNTYDLIGSAFVNAYTSGGTGLLNNNIRIRTGAAGADFLQLLPGESAFVPLLIGGAPNAICDPSGQTLEYLLISF